MGGFYGLKAATSVQFFAMALLCPATEAVILHGLDEYESGLDTEAPTTGAGEGGPAAGSQKSPRGQGNSQGSQGTPRWDTAKLRAYFCEQDCLTLARSVSCPVLLVHARTDEVVPFTHTLLLTQALPTDTTLVALAEGAHTTAQHDPRIHALTVDWLRTQLTSCSEHI
jgi:pimeloyl-ACP methyl ester carboxylesterase